MNATIEVICYKSKLLKNNEHPLMLRICRDRKRKYQSIGVSVKAGDWDFRKNKPKPHCPNQIQIESIIADKIKQYQSTILDLRAENKAFTSTTLIEKVKQPTNRKTVLDMFNDYINQLLTSNRTGYALSIKQVKNSLLLFNKHLDIYFSDIDISWLKRYEIWLRDSGLKENTIGIRFRTLRVLFNIAIEEKIVKSEYYPFDKYKVSKLSQKTAKRAIRKNDIKAILNYKGKTDYERLAIDLFTFSYLVGGINFVDIAYLTKQSIVENRLSYARRKTHKLISLPLQSKVIELIDKYSDENSKYLFPVLSPFHKTEQQKANRVHKAISKVNKALKSIGKELKLPIDLTTYVARHSFATVLKRSGVSTSIISESLGHSSEKITQIYLDSFENSQIDEAMKNLL